MMIGFIPTVLFVLLTYLYIRWIYLKQYWVNRRVPHVPPNPIVGSLTFIQRENAGIWFRRIYDSFKEPFVGIWIFWRPGLIVNSPEIARNILIKDQGNFRNRFTSSGTTDPVGRLNLFSLDDPLWTMIRKRLSPSFTGAKLRNVQLLLTKKSKELVERIDKERLKSDPIDLRNMMTDFATDIIGTSSFGVVSDATLTGESHLRTVSKDMMKFDFYRALCWCCSFFIPELVDLFRFKMFPRKSTEEMRQILRQIIAQRGGLENKVVEPRDLLDILIKIKQEANEELDMTENMMLAQAALFIQAGFDTSALTLSFATYELAFCPDAQEKLFKELREAQDKHGDDLLEASVLSQLTYLNCVISETLRKYPGLPWLDRVALKDYKIDDQLTIPAGTPVYVNVVGMHYDPDFYPEPEQFNPDRFLPEQATDIKPFTYMPFGEGPRKCIGQRLGLSTVRHALTAVVLNYEIRKIPNTPKPEDIEMKKETMLFDPNQKLSVEFVPRI